MIHPRSEWTDFQPRELAWLGKRFLVVHWTAIPTAADQAQSGTPALMRSMETVHINKGGYAIFYNMVVDQDGELWEGRGFGMRGGAQGVYDSDKQDLSVSAILGPGEEPSAAMYAALLRLWYEASALGWDAGLRGHKDFKPKACHGPDLYEWVYAPKPDEETDMAFTPEQETFLKELADTILSGGGNPRSLNYNLAFYRALAGRVGVGGDQPLSVADGVALVSDVNTGQAVDDAITAARAEAAAAKAIAQGNSQTLSKIKAVLP